MQKKNTNPSTQDQRNGDANTITYFFPQPKLFHMQGKKKITNPSTKDQRSGVASKPSVENLLSIL
jgi:hypothetical protein